MKKLLVLSAFICAAILSACSTGQVNKEILADGTVRYEGSTADDLAKKNVISGYVYENGASGSSPIQGAVVEIKNANLGMGYYKVITDKKGFFKIEDFVPRIRYIVDVRAPGYISSSYTDEITYNRELSIYLDKSAQVTGIVSGAGDKLLADVEVRLTPTERYDDGAREQVKSLFSKTDKSGEYRIDQVPAGSYLATFKKEGCITETAQINSVRSGESFRLPMRLFTKSSFAGTISIKDVDTPAANVQVSLTGRRSHYTTSYADGSFRIEDIKPGDYTLRFSHQGFYVPDAQKVTIHEGREESAGTILLSAKESQIELSASRYVFTPDAKIEFTMRSLRLEKVKMRVYKVPLAVLLKGRSDPNQLNPSQEKFPLVREREDSIMNFTPYEWRYQSLAMGEALPSGGYCLEVSGADRVFDRKFFTVTSTGLVVKRSREKVFAYVTDMVTNKPIANADIVVFDNTPKNESYRAQNYPHEAPERIENLPVQIMLKGKTDADGLYVKPFKNTLHLSILAVGNDGSFAFCSMGSPQTFTREESKYMIYTDRPVYRAGDKVFYKIVGKKRKQRFLPKASESIYYEIRNRDMDSVLKSGECTLDEWGTFNDSIELEADGNLGECAIRVGESKENLYASGIFYVEQYRKPEFFINVQPMKSFFTNGGSAEFKIESKYYFGAPLKNVQVHYRFYERKLRDTDTTYWWEEDYNPEESYDKIRDEGDSSLDENGVGVIRTSCGKFPYDREITLEATIVDKSNISITSKSTVRVGRGEFYIKVNPSKSFYESSDKKNVTIRTIAQDGVPVSADVKVKVYRYMWKPWERVYVHEKRPVAEYSVRTNAKGEALFELPKKFDVYGEFDIVAESKDKIDNPITASYVVWVYSGIAGKIESRFKNLELVLSETDLKGPGEITCLVKSRFQDAYVCITLEGKDVYDSRVVKMTGNITPVKILIKGEYAPNLYVTATMQRSRALFTNTVGVSLPDPEASLNVAITPEKEKYLPGEKAVIKVKTTDLSGVPVSADVSLGAVDEAIYAIRPDHTPKMKDFFYTKISNWVLTNYSYPITVLAGAAKEGKIKVREKFEDTAFWKGDIRTGKDGEYTVTFTLPDNLTTWRLTARGHDKTGRVGEKRNSILVTQDLIARVGKPRFFTEGDTVGLIGIVNSNTVRGLEKISTDFEIDGKKATPDESAKMSLPAFGSASEYYTMKVPPLKDSISLKYTAIADKDAKDALVHKLPVLPRGTPYAMTVIGDMAQNKNVELKPIADTDDYEFAPAQLILSVNPNPIVLMIKACRILSEYPYGCVEQTVSRYLPNLALKELLAQKGYSNVVVVDKLDDKIRVGTERIQAMQNDDGSWGWWSGDRGNEFITGYVVQALLMAKSRGHDVDASKLDRGTNALRRMLERRSNVSDDGKAFVLYVNALAKGWDQTAYKDLRAAKDSNAYRNAFLLRAALEIIKTGKVTAEQKKELSADITDLVTKLKGSMQKDSDGVYWNSPSYTWSWQGGRAEVTAQVLAALSEAGDTSTVPAMIVNSLTRRSKGGQFQSTKEASQVILAFCKYLEKQKAVGNEKSTSTIRFALEGKEIASVTFDKNDVENTGMLVKKIPLDKSMRKNIFKLTASGDAGGDVIFDAVLRGFLYYKDAGFLSLVKSESRSLNKLENGISLTRNYGSIRRVRDMNNNEYMVPQPITDAAGLKVGDEILVKIKFQAHDNFEYLLLEDYLPAGFEVVSSNVYDQYVPYSHQERWDEKMSYFFTKIEKDQIYEIAYVLRAELSGDFIAKPAKIECMYEPSIQGWALPARFKVQKGKEKNR
jgi:alpha-2-macroglobulin